MSFCPCGRERVAGERFCRTCGAELHDPVRYEPTVTSAPGPPPPAGYDPWAATGPYASPPGQPPPAPPLRPLPAPPMRPGPVQDEWGGPFALFDSRPDVLTGEGSRRRPGGRGPGPRNRIAVVAAVVVAIAVAGGAFALVRNHGQASAGSPPTHQASSAAAQSAPAQGTPAASSDATPLSSGPASSPPSTPATGTGGSAGVAVAAGAAGNAAEPQVLALVNRYFAAINAHDYPVYASLLDAQELQQITQPVFDSGYATTTDSDETLTGVSDTGSGGVAAMITFTSHQDPANSVDDSACTSWAITLFLVPNGTGYLIGAPPSGYHASYQAC